MEVVARSGRLNMRSLDDGCGGRCDYGCDYVLVDVIADVIGCDEENYIINKLCH